MGETREELLKRLEDDARMLRRGIWRTLRAGGGGHAGGSLSAADLLAALGRDARRLRGGGAHRAATRAVRDERRGDRRRLSGPAALRTRGSSSTQEAPV